MYNPTYTYIYTLYVHQHRPFRGPPLTAAAHRFLRCSQASAAARAKATAISAAAQIADENVVLLLSLTSPEDALKARAASREWMRLASDDDLWCGFFGELLSTFPAVSTWPMRGANETCVRWYFRCRAYARFAQGAGEAYHNNQFPHLRMLGTLHGDGTLSFRPDEPLSFPVAYGVLAELVLRWLRWLRRLRQPCVSEPISCRRCTLSRAYTSFSFSIVRSFCIMSIFVLAFSWLQFEYIHMLILSRHGGASTVEIIFLLVSRPRSTHRSRVSDHG